MKTLWLATAGELYGDFLAAGLGVTLGAVGLLVCRFDRIIHR